MSAEARGAISDFRSSDGPAQGLIADMRLTMSQAREATADLADNMEANMELVIYGVVTLYERYPPLSRSAAPAKAP